MIKKVVLFSIMAIASENIFAQVAETTNSFNTSSLAVLLTLIVAIVALILSVINTFRISYNKKISEVDLVNQKDDINISMEGINTALIRDIRHIRKEFNRSNRNLKTKEADKTNKPAATDVDTQKNTTETDKTPPIKKMSNNKRRFYRKTPKTQNSEKGVTDEQK